MPPFKKISSLNEICSEWVWRWLFYCLNQQAAPGKRILQRSYVVSTLNPNIRQHLLNLVCKTHMYKVNLSSKCYLIELLGDKSTQCLDLSQSGLYYIDEVFQFYRTLTLGLILNVSQLGVVCNVRLPNDRRHLPDLNMSFHRVFNQMSNLRWLTLSGLMDLTMMGILGCNCHHLEYLDISDSSYADDEGIARLLLKNPAIINGRSMEQLSRLDLETTELCKKLSFICISGTNISMLGVVLLLKSLPKIRSLGGHIDCGSVSKVISLLQPESDVRVFQFEEISDSIISPENASLLCIACPKITKFTTVLRSVEVMHIIHPLQSLTIEDVRGDPWHIYDYLQVRGSSLKELILPDNLICPLDLAWIVELTPNLERLHSNLIVEEGYEIPSWKELKAATVTVSSSKVLLSLLTRTPSLVDLNITFIPDPFCETFDCLNDDLFIYIALSDGLKHLEKLSIKECALSKRGIDCLLIHCPELWYFAHLIFWQNVTQDDIRRLNLEAIQNNWKLKLVLRDDWEKDSYENSS